MPMLAAEAAVRLLRCPRCKSELDDAGGACSNRTCGLSGRPFPACAGQPVLIDDEDSIVDAASVASAPVRPEGFLRATFRRLSPKNGVAARVSRRLAADVAALQTARRPRVLVVGGGSIGSGLEEFYARREIDIVAFDVYPSAFTHFVADGHAIPLADGSVDGVIVQAVLEHVLDPATVVAEIHRVLRADGLVYADTPFLQHVHEGPYDFTRFTESGHRWLFRRFTRVESGTVAGIGTQLTWSVAHAARSVLPIKGVASAVRLAMTPLAVAIDRVVKPEHAVDGASSVYFYGRRSSHSLRPKDMIGHYRGAQTIPARAP